MPPRNRKKGKNGGSPKHGAAAGRERTLPSSGWRSPRRSAPTLEPIDLSDVQDQSEDGTTSGAPVSSVFPDDTDSEDLDAISLERLLTGPGAPYFHLAASALAVVLYISPKASPRVWGDDVELRPAPPLQQFVWHVSDTLHTVGFEATVSAGLVAVVLLLGLALWLTDHPDPPVSERDEEQGASPSPEPSPERTSPTAEGQEGAVAAEEDEPPVFLGLVAFVAVVAFMGWSQRSPLHLDASDVTVHANVAEENAKIIAAIAELQAAVANATAELAGNQG